MNPPPPISVTSLSFMTILDKLRGLPMPRPAPRRKRSRSLLTTSRCANRARPLPRAQMAELVDAPASGAGARKGVEVRVLFWAPATHKALKMLGDRRED